MARRQIEELRSVMKAHGIDAYLIVTDDFHGSEYVGDYFKCREYVSGFDGSAGTLVVTQKEARLWTDGRYFLQAAEQLAGTGIALMKSGEEGVPTIDVYLYDALGDEKCVGFDGRTVTAAYADFLKKRLVNRRLCWKEDIDLVGEIWKERPAMSAEPVWLLDEKYAGKSRAQKLTDLRNEMKEKKADCILISALDEICWLYNIRGNDVEYNPVALSYTLVFENHAYLYMNLEAVSDEVRRELETDGIKLRDYLQIYRDLQDLEVEQKNEKLVLQCDKSAVNTALLSNIPSSVKMVYAVSPVKLAKAVKNATEMENEISAHISDGVAVTKLIYWLKKAYKEEECIRITELDICNKLEEFRKESEDYLGQSFAPIAGSGPHGAIIHYEPTVDSNIEIVDNSFVLLDTGGHYLRGTTDITRTISCGTLTEKQKQNYTAVLCGNLNIGAVYFKHGCTGANFDYLARTALWQLGLDYNHGTGHGVGYLLNVHEGPNAIRLKNSDNSVGTVLEEGVITSNEPGVYLENQYGIRLENLIMCVNDKKTEYGQFMKMKTLTLVPFDREAIDVAMLDSRQLELLNKYHQRVFEEIGQYLDEEEKAWLKLETAPL